MTKDEELVKKAKNGCIACFEQIIEKHKRQVYRIVISIIKDPIDAEDITQEVFLKIFESLNKFKGKSTFSTWLYRISVNTSLTYLKKNKKNLEFIDDYKNFESSDIEENIYNRDLLKVIFKEANSLPKKEKLVFILKFQNGFSNKEIAEILKTSSASVKANLYHALKKIRSRLRQKGYIGDEFYE